MAIEFSCSGCGQRYKVADGLAGRAIRCQKCETPLKIPSAAPAMAPSESPAMRGPTASARPPLQSFDTEAPAKPRPAARPPLQSFSSAPPTPTPKPTPIPSRPSPRPAPRPPVEEQVYDAEALEIEDEPELDEDLEIVEDAATDPYGVDEVYAPPRATRPAYDEADDSVGRPGRPGKGKKGKRMEYAGFWKRLCALIVDNIIFRLLSYGIGFGLGIMIGVYYSASLHRSVTPEDLAGFAPYFLILELVLWVLYFAGMNASERQGTLGKNAMGIIVTDTEGHRIGFGRAVARQFAWLLSVFTIFIGFFMVLFTGKKQALHDLLCGTLVLKK